ncbi:hypothetical protein FOBRF1_003893 [Fusarium oxysporum]
MLHEIPRLLPSHVPTTTPTPVWLDCLQDTSPSGYCDLVLTSSLDEVTYKLRYKPNLTYQPTELQVLKQLQTPSGEKSLQGASGQFPLVWLWLLPR